MKLYLARHGKAESGADDHARRLTDRGRSSVERVAQRLANGKVRVARIEHSGLVRAVETAQILAAAIGGSLEAADDLHPLDDVGQAANRLQRGGETAVMIVGHQPFMGRMAAHLLTGDAENAFLHLPTGAVAYLSDDEGHWSLRWLLTPDIA
ncbi:MAG: phosphohistidine phosphatase SixA [Chloroflexota bacterium]